MQKHWLYVTKQAFWQDIANIFLAVGLLLNCVISLNGMRYMQARSKDSPNSPPQWYMLNDGDKNRSE